LHHPYLSRQKTGSLNIHDITPSFVDVPRRFAEMALYFCTLRRRPSSQKSSPEAISAIAQKDWTKFGLVLRSA
jgi:hypothetical protein